MGTGAFPEQRGETPGERSFSLLHTPITSAAEFAQKVGNILMPDRLLGQDQTITATGRALALPLSLDQRIIAGWHFQPVSVWKRAKP